MSISIKVLTTAYANIIHHRFGGQHFIGINWSRPSNKVENEAIWSKAVEYAQKHRINQWLLDRSKVSVYTPPDTWIRKDWFQNDQKNPGNTIAVVMADQLFCQLLSRELEPMYQSDAAFQAGVFCDWEESKDWLLNTSFTEKEVLMSA